MNKKNYRVYVDLEYCYPGMTKEKGRPTETELRQVVQIAAILYNCTDGKEIQYFERLVIPHFEKELPLFFIELTKITQEDVKKRGESFKKVLNEFVIFCKNYPIWTFHGDWGVLKQNCSYIGIDFPFKDKPFIKVKELLVGWGIDPEMYSSGTLYKATGIEMKGHVHNALHDVRSMATAVYYFEN